nr:DUF350 domain-containing protein [Gordonia hirsuta]
MTTLRDNLADLTSYGLVSVAVLIIGFIGLDLVTPGSLRTLIWRENNRTATVLAVAQALGLMIALAAGIGAAPGLELWRGVLYTAVYGVITVALMMFSFVLVDALTPGRLGSLLLDHKTPGGGAAHPAVWLNAVLFVAIGVFVYSALGL